MPYPHQPYGLATSPEPMSFLDDTFNQVAAGTSIPCSAAGANSISLTPLSGFPALTSYTELCSYRFVAAATSSGAVTAQYNGLGFLPVYHADGATQANVSDFVAGQQYIITFHQALNGGLGGFFFEAPSQPTGVTTWFQPGGRLTPVINVPVPFTSQTVSQFWYAPYVHPYVPIYNGSTVSMVQFTSSLSDTVGLAFNMAGSATWPINSSFDVFVTTFSGGVPKLATLAWTNPTTRAVALALFAGFLTNGGANVMQTPLGAIGPVPANQATFLGSFFTAGSNGTTVFQFGGNGSGGVNATFFICNYYNKVLFNTIVGDTGASYTYTSNTPRQARASAGNQVNYMQSDNERAMIVNNVTRQNIIGGGGSGFTGIAVNVTNAFATAAGISNAAGSPVTEFVTSPLTFSATGEGFIASMEEGDGVNANTFCAGSNNQLLVSLWL